MEATCNHVGPQRSCSLPVGHSGTHRHYEDVEVSPGTTHFRLFEWINEGAKTMKLSAIDHVQDLRQNLEHARRILNSFENEPGEMVQAYAKTVAGDYGTASRVALLPVPKSLAVSAAKREVSKIVEALAHLGVEVDEQESLTDTIARMRDVRGMQPANINHVSPLAFIDGATVGGIAKGH